MDRQSVVHTSPESIAALTTERISSATRFCASGPAAASKARVT
jgi:hypothetical protein